MTFAYRNGALHCEDVGLASIAEAVGTPAYVYSAGAVRDAYNRFAGALAGLDARICYALKANSNQAVLRVLASLGAGMDVVSEGELRRARLAGVPGSRITFSGVGKSAGELALGLAEKIHCFNVESEQELQLLSTLAAERGMRAPIALRVNPDVDAKTHAKISTGKAENKFGIPLSRARAVYAEAARLPGIVVTGVDMHIGSQITELTAFEEAFARLADFVRVLQADDHALDHVDLGGGLGIPYKWDETDAAYAPALYAECVRRHFGDLGLALTFEPGRLLVGNAGVLLTEVQFVKQGEVKTFVVVDAGMNDLIRPTLYEAHHEILPLVAPSASPAGAGRHPGENQGAASATPASRGVSGNTVRQVVDVVGPVCETGDYLALDRALPPLAAGDVLAICSAGAYGAVQAGTYNTRRLVPEVLVDSARFAVVRPRQTFEELIGLDAVPDWLA